MLLNKLMIYSQVHIWPDMYRRIMNFYCLMHIIVCHKKLMRTYINAITHSSQRKQALACHHAALFITISNQSWCLKTVVPDAMLEISR